MLTPNDLPQLTGNGQPEIFNLLKIGNYKVEATQTGFSLTPEHPNAPAKEIAAEPKSKQPSAIKTAFVSAYRFIKPYNGILVYPVVFIGSFLIFYSTMNFPSLAAAASGLFTRSQDQQ